MNDERFTIEEKTPCSCGMRRFTVTDTTDGTISHAHVGYLNYHDSAHRAVSQLLAEERKEKDKS